MPAHKSFDYAIVRVVPHVERGERINVGAILFCRALAYLEARVALDVPRLLALAPELDAADVRAHLEVIPRVCRGGEEAGPIGKLSQAERFHWLVAPRSTVVQPSCVHSGLCDDPAAALDRLYATMVAPPGPATPSAHHHDRQPDLVTFSQASYAEAMTTLENALPPGRGVREVRQMIARALRALGRETPGAEKVPPNA